MQAAMDELGLSEEEARRGTATQLGRYVMSKRTGEVLGTELPDADAAAYAGTEQGAALAAWAERYDVTDPTQAVISDITNKALSGANGVLTKEEEAAIHEGDVVKYLYEATKNVELNPSTIPALNEIGDMFAKAGLPPLTVTSAVRTPEQSAEATLAQIDALGRDEAKSLYAASYDGLIDRYYDAKDAGNTEAMQTVRTELTELSLARAPNNPHVTGNAVDIRSKHMTAGEIKQALELLDEAGYIVYDESHSLYPNLHIEGF
tara:strand:- start:665 stop:1450 length:786 start_codon:yes stop_codon:yes gene_type:complete